jgi:hypothetical protein
MKKLGTPIGAGPGNANENVGFVGVGTPFFAVAAGGFVDPGVAGPVGPLGPVPCLGPVGPVAPGR